MLDKLPNVTHLRLMALRPLFRERGFDIRIVGGSVRDMLLDQVPKDIDLCTDATPEEQIAIYEDAGVTYVPTGLQHGTITVILCELTLEITSLRTEQDHDGRWAKMTYTRDWIEDLSRRDLTVNAMALTLDGEIIDPFGGRADLEAKCIRFVGDPQERMREDYLRILRWFRFQGRLNPNGVIDRKVLDAVRACKDGLGAISRERVWSEMARIISGPGGPRMMDLIHETGVDQHISLPVLIEGALRRMHIAHQRVCDPVAIMAMMLGDTALVQQLAEDWRWSAVDRSRGEFFSRWTSVKAGSAPRIDWKSLLAFDEQPREWVVTLLRLAGRDADAAAAEAWEIPEFPVRGRDLIEIGVRPGPGMGKLLNILKMKWLEDDFWPTREVLLAMVPENA